jgi:hypothetical protein
MNENYLSSQLEIVLAVAHCGRKIIKPLLVKVLLFNCSHFTQLHNDKN